MRLKLCDTFFWNTLYIALDVLIMHAKLFPTTFITLTARGQPSSRSLTRTPTMWLKFGTLIALDVLITHAEPFRVTFITLTARGQ